MTHHQRRPLILLLALSCDASGQLDGSAPAGDDEDVCAPGGPGCACDESESCDPGLVCREGSCVPGVDEGCGNGSLDAGEQCDLGALNRDDGICTSSCTVQVCGDGHLGPGEGCDDGNEDDNDDCMTDCVPARCGDAVVQSSESCDDGNDVNDDACSNECALPSCGDGIVQDGETCDDGDADDENGCTTRCTIVPGCGNGSIEPGEVCFVEASSLPTGPAPRAVETCDVDRDGDVDVLATSAAAGEVRWLINDGAGGFAGHVDIPVLCQHPIDVAVADLDSDYIDDLVIACFESDDLSLLYGTGDTAVPFAAPVLHWMKGGAPRQVDAGDADGDGWTDIGYAGSGEAAPGKYLTAALTGNGIAPLSAMFLGTSVGIVPTGVALAQLDGQGPLELVSGIHGSGIVHAVTVAPGEPRHESTVAAASVWLLAVADFDGDGLDDIAGARWDEQACDYATDPTACAGDHVTIVFGHETSLLGDTLELDSGKGTIDVAVGDFDGDGRSDVAAVNAYSGTISLFLSRQNRSFATLELTGAGVMPFSLGAGDLNGDDVDDLAATSTYTSTVEVFLSSP